MLNNTARHYQQLVELSPEAIFVFQGNRMVLLNPAGVRLLGGRCRQDLLGRPLFDFVHPDHHFLFREQAHPASNTCTSISPFVEQAWLRIDGSRFHAEVAATTLTYNDAPALQIVARDITERKHNEAIQLGQNRILNMIATGTALEDILGEIVRFFESMSCRGLCSILLLDDTDTMLGDRIAPNLPQLYLACAGKLVIGPRNGSCGTAAFRAEPVIVTDIAADELWAERRELALRHGLRACSSWPIFGRNRKVLGTFALYFREAIAPNAQEMQLFRICTELAGIAIESRMSEEKIRYLAHYDGLTSLPNRFLFREYLDLALRNAERHGKKFAVLFLDLDEFKNINDTLGHEAGDHVLRETARRLLNSLRSTDKLARMGGDEFYVLIEELNNGRHAADVAQKLLDAASLPVRIGDRERRLGASIGIALYPDDGVDARVLLKNADNAMYRAKEQGKNSYCFHSSPEENECNLPPRKPQPLLRPPVGSATQPS